MAMDDRRAAFDARAGGIRFIGFDFDGVMTDNRVYVFEDGREAVVCSRAEGYGLRRLAAHGVAMAVISTEINPVVARRCEKLKLMCVQGVEDKVQALGALLDERGLDFTQAAFVGNDVNDLAVLSRVAFPVVVADAHPDLDGLGAFRTSRNGGDGAVREICDLISAVIEAENEEIRA
ncbi:MAG: haloacid dehalogenase [Oceanicaulis sp.]